MLKSLKLSYLLFFLSIFTCLNLYSMDEEKKIVPISIDLEDVMEKARGAVEQSKEVIGRLPDLMQPIKDRKQNQVNQTINQIKSENTILLRLGKYLAFYKSDMLRGGIFAVDALAEFFTYKKVFDQKIDYVLEMVKTDSHNLLGLLNQIDSAEKNDTRNRLSKFISKKFKTIPEEAALKKYINNKHKMIGYNPFISGLMPYLILNLLKTKALYFAEKSLLVQMNGKKLVDGNLCEVYSSAYEKADDGNLYKLTDMPFSPATILMSILNPRYMIERINYPMIERFMREMNLISARRIPEEIVVGAKQAISFIPSFDESLRMVNQIFNLRIPKVIFSQVIKIFASLISLGIAVKITDAFLNTSWTSYILKNKAQLITLLEQYNSVDKGDIETAIKVEQDLKQFISNGHKQGLFSNLWIGGKSSAQWRIKLLFLSMIMGAAGLKAYSAYRAN